jgi:uncharacterized protein YkwD
MKRRLEFIPVYRSTVVFVGFLWAATIACAGAAQSQTSTKPDAATTPQTDLHITRNTPKKKPSKPVVWHHFGDSDNAPVAGQSQPGVWRHFGPNPGAPKVGPGETPPRKNFGTDRMAELERQMWQLVNRDRLDPEASAETGGQVQPLRWNKKLAAVARAHSRDMLEQRFFDHVDPEGRGPSARINAAGIPWQALGENIAMHWSVPGAEAAFMNEPPFQKNHRANILNAEYTDVGIGIVQGPNGSLYITQDFVAIPASPRASGSGFGRRERDP